MIQQCRASPVPDDLPTEADIFVFTFDSFKVGDCDMSVRQDWSNAASQQVPSMVIYARRAIVAFPGGWVPKSCSSSDPSRGVSAAVKGRM